jgi:hypothetical protein
MDNKRKEADAKRPVYKANMDKPQEEFIEPLSGHIAEDKGHGHEVGQSRVDQSRNGEKDSEK